ncbi:hypothetical protein IMZ08_13280 [Bacillus luteolus]|uniref:Regulatory protein YrvL n=1 Tax=Litchfieldia luteola TaxID=682179 RepID=A0ABR9QKL3_9BACI|nr:YrvL family regulatory protein [Cytobacillus luteolus]MBE4909035.1 hypothetical protein [Cytobacillus luteolus]MBP1941893.1 hypothetical protein [Cytobacillus luteolus]
MNNRGKDKVIVWSAMIFLFFVVISSVFSLYFFGILGVLHLTGVHYDSMVSMLIFVLLYVGISIITDVFSKLAKYTLSEKITGVRIILGRMVVDFFFSWLAIHLADELMSAINLSLNSELTLAIVLAIAEEAFRKPTQVKYKLSRPPS